MGLRKSLIIFWCSLIYGGFCCIEEDNHKTRVFSSLQDYWRNKISFDPCDKSFLGSNISFSAKNISRIPENAFITYTSANITSIDLSNKSIISISDRAFTTLTGVINLDLSYNMISNLTRYTFHDLSSTTVLNLKFNRITFLPDHVFSLKKLRTLYLSYNNIYEFNQKAFGPNSSLEILNLSHNYMKHFTPNFIHLKELYLGNNSIALFNTSSMSKHRDLQVLDIPANSLVLLYIYKGSFNLNGFRLFNLSNNYLVHLPINELIEEFSNTQTVIDLNNNPVSCSSLTNNLLSFKEHNVTLAPGGSFYAKKQINGFVCDNLPEEKENLHISGNQVDEQHKDQLIHTQVFEKHHVPHPRLSMMYVVISLTVIVIVFCAFLTIDYFLGVRLRDRLSQRVRFCLSPNISNSNIVNGSAYVQLHSSS